MLGAGLCALTASRNGSNAGLRAVVLDLRGRIGGRTHTATWDGAPNELGGTWVHSSQPHVWAEIQRYALPLHASPPAPLLMLRRADGDVARVDLAAYGARIF